jgi:GntR family histidine utilization transcriptional repressor
MRAAPPRSPDRPAPAHARAATKRATTLHHGPIRRADGTQMPKPARHPGQAKRAPLPRYSEIRRDLEHAILSGKWPPGHRIPAEQELLAHYRCSRMTVNKAMTSLAEAGLIVRRRRSGSFVANPAGEKSVIHIQGIEQDVANSGRTYRLDLLSRTERMPTASQASSLSISRTTPILTLTCVHHADGVPLVLEQRLINLDAVPAARGADFAKIAPGTWLLSEIPWSQAEHHIKAVNADPNISRMLKIETGQACLVVERRTRHEQKVITHVVLTYPGHRQTFVAHFEPSHSVKPR